MVVNRPEIILYTCRPDEDYLKEVCAGIEEEGVLYRIYSCLYARLWDRDHR